MKKCLTVLTCLVLIGAGLNVHLQFQSNQSGKIGFTLGNIEALAQGEDVGKRCYSLGSVDCPHNIIKVMYTQ